MPEIIVFGFLSLLNLAYSWRWLRNPRAHGFYRFFAFETLLALIVIQADVWFSDPMSMLQLVSWGFLGGSFGLALHGFWLLWLVGKPRENFEQTTVLVTKGAYRYIRHPLYCSLLLGTVGVLLKSFSGVSVGLAFSSGVFLVLTALVEEQENLARFGEPYVAYRQKTRMFIPWLL